MKTPEEFCEALDVGRYDGPCLIVHDDLATAVRDRDAEHAVQFELRTAAAREVLAEVGDGACTLAPADCYGRCLRCRARAALAALGEP
jgi:hypothetical protein